MTTGVEPTAKASCVSNTSQTTDSAQRGVSIAYVYTSTVL
jgi:hypothetical protein